MQGSECPASGFCGVEECGTWSSGSKDRGVPCNTVEGMDAGDLDSNATTDAGDGMPGNVVTNIDNAGAGVTVTASLAGFAPQPAEPPRPTEARKPPKGMMKDSIGSRFTPHDVPADIPDVMMTDGQQDYDYYVDYEEEGPGDADDEDGDAAPGMGLRVGAQGSLEHGEEQIAKAKVEEDSDDFSEDVGGDEASGGPSGGTPGESSPCAAYGEEC